MSFVKTTLCAAAMLLVVQTDQQALQRMVSTERAFAAATAELGVRDGFLTFFGDDAIALVPGASGAGVTTPLAKESLRSRPQPKLPLAAKLRWEPFTGQMSSDGTLGWLTGPFVNAAETTNDILGKGAYFSVWKRQADGTYRVWLDEGVTLPSVWQNASEFRVAPDPDAGAVGSASETIAAAEASVAAGGDAWRARLADQARLHRQGEMPKAGRAAVSEWSAGWSRVKYTTIKTEAAASGDLAVTVGGYDATKTAAGAGTEHGTWVRVWKRAVTGAWRIVFESSKST